MNNGLHSLHPTAMLIAEDSTTYPGVTRDVSLGGLGFDYKWDLGWAYDTLKYFESNPNDRAFLLDKITFSFYYAQNERYILPFSHDEVAQGRKTIIDKLHGNYDEKFAQAKILYLYMILHPGKKLNFMGNELAMFREWDVYREQDWGLLDIPKHNFFFQYITKLNKLYFQKNILWELDCAYDSFEWIDCKSDNRCVFGYIRTNKNDRILALFNFSDKDATIAPEVDGKVNLILNTNWELFGGPTKKCASRTLPQKLPPYCGLVFNYQ